MALTRVESLTAADAGTSGTAQTTTGDSFTIACYAGGIQVIDVTGGDNDTNIIGTYTATIGGAGQSAKEIKLATGMDVKLRATMDGTTAVLGY